MDYATLSKEQFDAVVTGELTHQAIWLEVELDKLISDYFVKSHDRRDDFQRLILRRDGLTAQDKIEIVRGMLPLFNLAPEVLANWKSLLKRIEDFKSTRNAMAHGIDATPEPYSGKLVIELINRAGAEKKVHISIESHKDMIANAEGLHEEVMAARFAIFEQHQEKA